MQPDRSRAAGSMTSFCQCMLALENKADQVAVASESSGVEGPAARRFDGASKVKKKLPGRRLSCEINHDGRLPGFDSHAGA
ncbi:hypothetical protein [Burkholderia plantarii]|uniref:hypothetical protein n=1 Tax=Burkholderia plantarii TaxID=41899 RepID=UPI0018DD6ECC|nr:hypothetical protein [Burkholderia plantarii]MBI0329646.1 hypothetical protein [Burkholderia plantarii]